GYLLPTISGNYGFNVLADDGAQLMVSTDNLRPHLRTILYAPGDCGACGNPGSSAVTLTAGEAYYFEALFQEGTGGDYLRVNWTPPGGSTTTIPGANLRYCFDPIKVPFIVDGPHDASVLECRP